MGKNRINMESLMEREYFGDLIVDGVITKQCISNRRIGDMGIQF
jgi:hypothetical protein